MISEAKQAANVANAQHSSGPRTPAGKAASSQNAVTHGLTAQNILPRTDEEKIEFAAIRSQAYAEYEPCGLTGTLDDVLDPEYAKPIARLNRYYAMHERSLYRALRALKAEQTNRALRDKALALPRPIPVLADFSKLNRKSSSHPAPARQVPPTPPAPPR